MLSRWIPKSIPSLAAALSSSARNPSCGCACVPSAMSSNEAKCVCARQRIVTMFTLRCARMGATSASTSVIGRSEMHVIANRKRCLRVTISSGGKTRKLSSRSISFAWYRRSLSTSRCESPLGARSMRKESANTSCSVACSTSTMRARARCRMAAKAAVMPGRSRPETVITNKSPSCGMRDSHRAGDPGTSCAFVATRLRDERCRERMREDTRPRTRRRHRPECCSARARRAP